MAKATVERLKAAGNLKGPFRGNREHSFKNVQATFTADGFPEDHVQSAKVIRPMPTQADPMSTGQGLYYPQTYVRRLNWQGVVRAEGDVALDPLMTADSWYLGIFDAMKYP
jgi:hypothetical protein